MKPNMKITARYLFFLLFVSVLFWSAPGYTQKEIRYVAMGDSYTIGTGVAPKDAWPFLLVDLLKAKGIHISLIANPSHNGWTTLHALEREMPVLRKANADFVTVMIGVNDWVQDSTDEQFRENFAALLGEVLIEMKDPRKVLVIDIPDFSVTPQGAAFSSGRNISRGIAKFNMIIAEEAGKRNIAVIDVYTASQGMKADPSLIARDGLHPSEKGHALFAAQIYPAAKTILQGQ